MQKQLKLKIKEQDLFDNDKICYKKLYSLIDESHKHLDCEGCSGFDFSCIKYKSQIELWRGEYR